MIVNLRTSSGLQKVQSISVRDSAGLHTVSSVALRDGSGLHGGAVSGSVNITPNYANGSANSKASIRIYTNTVSAVVTGGVGPFSYAWSVGDPSWTISSSGSASTSFRSPATAPGDQTDTTAFVTVTDTNGSAFSSSVISVTATNVGFN